MTIIIKFIILSFSILLTANCNDFLKNISHPNDQFNNTNIPYIREKPGKLMNKNPLYNEVMTNLTRINNVITDLINSYKEINNNQETVSADYDNCETDEVNTENPIDRATRSDYKAPEIQVTSSMYSEKNNSNENDQDDGEKETEVNNRSSDNQTHEKLTGFLSDKTDVSHGEGDENDKTNSKENDIKITKKGSSKTIRTTPVQITDTKMNNALTNERKKKPKIITEKKKPHNVKRQKQKSNEDSASVFMRNSDDCEECDSISDKSEDPGPNTTPKKVKDITQGQQKINRKIDTIFDFNGNMTIHTVGEETIQGSAQTTTDDEQIRPWYRNMPHKTHFKVQRDKLAKAANDSVESYDDKKALAKVQVLRKDYGDACLKVVVKKCYKACKQVSKEISSMYKSNEVFTEVFLRNSRRTCIKEFSGKMYARHGGLFPDMSKDEYLAAACLPIKTLAQRLRKSNKTALTEPERKLNILRDGYERECQKISAAKCTNACSNAGNITCQTEKCDGKKLSKLKKECKRYCQWSYQDRKPAMETKLSDRSSDEEGSDDSSSNSSITSSDSGNDSDDSDSTIYVKDKDKTKENTPNRYKIKRKPKNRADSESYTYDYVTDLKYLRLPAEDNQRSVNNRLNKSKIQDITTNSKQKYSKIDSNGEKAKKLRYKVKVRNERTKTESNEANHGTEENPVIINTFKERKANHKHIDRKEEARKQKDKDNKEGTKKHTDNNSKKRKQKHKYNDNKEETKKHRDYDTEQETKKHKVYYTKQGTHEHKYGSSDERTTTNGDKYTRKRRTKNADYVSEKRTTKYEENNEDSRASDNDKNDSVFSTT